LPPDLAVGPFFYLPPSGPAAVRIDRLAQVAKFGVPGTDMPGHEYLSDEEIASIAAWVAQLDGQQSQNRSSTSYLQEKNK
jgi:cytochrome c oxidase cbb3-type subunit 2